MRYPWGEAPTYVYSCTAALAQHTDGNLSAHVVNREARDQLTGAAQCCPEIDLDSRQGSG